MERVSPIWPQSHHSDHFGHRRHIAGNAENLIDWWLRDDLNFTVSSHSGSRSCKPLNGKLRGPNCVICTNTEKSIMSDQRATLLGQVESAAGYVVQFHRRCWCLPWCKRDVQDNQPSLRKNTLALVTF